MEQLIQMNENEEDLLFQRPRSHSIPNMQYVDMSDQFDFDPREKIPNGGYIFKQERNFGYEI